MRLKQRLDIICYFFVIVEKSNWIKDSSIGWGYGAMNWPIYYVWDKYQKILLKNFRL